MGLGAEPALYAWAPGGRCLAKPSHTQARKPREGVASPDSGAYALGCGFARSRADTTVLS